MHLPFCLWPISLVTNLSISIHFVGNFKISVFLWLTNIPWCSYTLFSLTSGQLRLIDCEVCCNKHGTADIFLTLCFTSCQVHDEHVFFRIHKGILRWVCHQSWLNDGQSLRTGCPVPNPALWKPIFLPLLTWASNKTFAYNHSMSLPFMFSAQYPLKAGKIFGPQLPSLPRSFSFSQASTLPSLPLTLSRPFFPRLPLTFISPGNTNISVRVSSSLILL